MIKNLHFIQSDSAKTGTMRSYAFDQGKKFYSDFQVYFWNSSIIDTLIDAVPFIKKCKELGHNQIVDSYVAVSVTAELGGLAINTDCMMVKPLPEAFFEKPSYVFNTESSGAIVDLACCMYNEVNSDIAKELWEYFRHVPEGLASSGNLYSVVNANINSIFAKYGLNLFQSRLEDTSTESINVFSAVNFGLYDHSSNSILTTVVNPLDPCIVNTHKSALKDSYNEKMSLYYMLIDDNTDLSEVIAGINDFAALDTSSDRYRSCLALIMNTGRPDAVFCIDYLRSKVNAVDKKFFKVLSLGVGIPKLQAIKMLPDYIGPIFHNLEICRNMLFNTGKLTNPLGSPWAVATSTDPLTS